MFNHRHTWMLLVSAINANFFLIGRIIRQNCRYCAVTFFEKQIHHNNKKLIFWLVFLQVPLLVLHFLKQSLPRYAWGEYSNIHPFITQKIETQTDARGNLRCIPHFQRTMLHLIIMTKRLQHYDFLVWEWWSNYYQFLFHQETFRL